MAAAPFLLLLSADFTVAGGSALSICVSRRIIECAAVSWSSSSHGGFVEPIDSRVVAADVRPLHAIRGSRPRLLQDEGLDRAPPRAQPSTMRRQHSALWDQEWLQ